MSQYGALGFANEGWTLRPDPRPLLPGRRARPGAGRARARALAESKPALTVSLARPRSASATSFGTIYALAAGSLALGPKLRMTRQRRADRRSPGPIVFLPGQRAARARRRAYRGQIEVAVTGPKLNAINIVGLEQYLAGRRRRGRCRAPGRTEALKAQAVAARSYALAHRVSGQAVRPLRGRAQPGLRRHRGREPATTAAVQATAGRGAALRGQADRRALPLDLGRRRRSPRPRSSARRCRTSSRVDDPAQRALAGPPLGADAGAGGDDPQGPEAPRAGPRRSSSRAAPSGRVRSVQVTTAAGATTVTRRDAPRGLGLRSTWVTQPGVALARRARRPVVYGRRASRSRGKAQGVKGAVLAAARRRRLEAGRRAAAALHAPR